MKSFIIGIFIFASLIFTSSCKDIKRSDVSYPNQDSIIASQGRAKNNGEKVEGRFLNIQKLTDRTYELSIQLNQDSVAVFETLMPLDQNEISLLKKVGNNIVLTYKVYQDSVTKKPIKMVQYMQPIYEIQSK